MLALPGLVALDASKTLPASALVRVTWRLPAGAGAEREPGRTSWSSFTTVTELNVMWGPATVAVICVSAAGVENPAGWTMASVVAPGACGSNGVAALVTAPMNGTGVASVPTAVSEL